MKKKTEKRKRVIKNRPGALLAVGDQIDCYKGIGKITGTQGERHLIVQFEGGSEVVHRGSCEFMPSAEQIDAATAEIRSHWSYKQRWERTAPADRIWPLVLAGSPIPLEDWEIEAHFTELYQREDAYGKTSQL